MKYRFLGQTGMRVSELCLGCMTFEIGYSKNITEEIAFRILDTYVDRGGNFFDMADNYPGVEELFGRWLKTKKGKRDQFVIATKVRFPSGEKGPNDVGLTRKHIMQSIDASLKKTGAEYIDLYQAHCFDELTPLEETLRVFDDLIKSGKIRYAGASNFAGWQIAKAATLSKTKNLPFFHSYQMQYNLLTRSPEWEVIPAAIDANASINAWSPLAAGWLSGKYERDKLPPENSRMGKIAKSKEEWESIQKENLSLQIPHPTRIAAMEEMENKEIEIRNDRKWRIIEAVADVAKAHGVSSAQIALAWVLAQKPVCSVVMGVSKLEQLEDNLGALDVILSQNELDWLNKVSDPGLYYPYDFFARYGQWR